MKVLSVSEEKNISDIMLLHESKKGRKKNTSESELGFNNDS